MVGMETGIEVYTPFLIVSGFSYLWFMVVTMAGVDDRKIVKYRIGSIGANTVVLAVREDIETLVRRFFSWAIGSGLKYKHETFAGSGAKLTYVVGIEVELWDGYFINCSTTNGIIFMELPVDEIKRVYGYLVDSGVDTWAGDEEGDRPIVVIEGSSMTLSQLDGLVSPS